MTPPKKNDEPTAAEVESAAEGGRADERSEAGSQPAAGGPEKAAKSEAKKPARGKKPAKAAAEEAPAEEAGAEEAGAEEEAAEEEAAEEEAAEKAPAEAAPAEEEAAAEEAAVEEEKPAKEEKPARRERKRDQPRAKREKGEPAVVVRAQARYVRTSARKARLVCDHIRGKDVEEARAILSFTPRGAAKPWMKLLESAIANAEHNHELVGDELRIASVHADEGPTLKRYRPRAMGRATRIRKRTSHLTIMLTPKE